MSGKEEGENRFDAERESFISSRVPELRENRRFFAEFEGQEYLLNFWRKAISLFIRFFKNSYFCSLEEAEEFFTVEGFFPTNLRGVLAKLEDRGEFVLLDKESDLVFLESIAKRKKGRSIRRFFGSCFRSAGAPRLVVHYRAYLAFGEELRDSLRSIFETQPVVEIRELMRDLHESTGKSEAALEPLLSTFVRSRELSGRKIGVGFYLSADPIADHLHGIFKDIVDRIERKLEDQLKDLLKEENRRIHSAQNLKIENKRDESEKELHRSFLAGQGLATTSQLSVQLDALKSHLAANEHGNLQPHFELLLEELEAKVLAAEEGSQQASPVRKEMLTLLYDELKVPGEAGSSLDIDHIAHQKLNSKTSI